MHSPDTLAAIWGLLLRGGGKEGEMPPSRLSATPLVWWDILVDELSVKCSIMHASWTVSS